MHEAARDHGCASWCRFLMICNLDWAACSGVRCIDRASALHERSDAVKHSVAIPAFSKLQVVAPVRPRCRIRPLQVGLVASTCLG
jgi:hypothetical protein